MLNANSTQDSSTLVNELNALLNALQLPILLQSPTDLTPSLLIAILELLLSMRLPLEFSPSRSSSAAHIQSMKMFLGVLESDIVKVDVGLSNVDPGRLANGEWEEVVFVGEVLCRVGRRLGVTVDHDEGEGLQYVAEGNEGSIARIDRPYSPTTSAMSIVTKKTNTVSTFSLHRHTESNTSISFSDYPPDSSTPIQSPRKGSHLPTLAPLSLSPPHCIHEVPSPSIMLTPDIDDAFPNLYCHIRPETSIRYRDQTQEPAVRHTGYIEPVDEELELLSFESSYSMYSHKLPIPFHDHNVSLSDLCYF
jgi:hypothetical protein